MIESEPSSLWSRLRRRKLFTWTAAYVTFAAALFGTLQAAGEVFDWPAGLLRAVVFLLLAGLGVTLVLAWFHGEQGRQRVTGVEALLLLLVAGSGIGAATVAARSAGSGDGAGATAPLMVHAFTDRSAGARYAYLASGLAEEVRKRLSAGREAPVARSSSASVPGAFVVDGAVEGTGDDVRVTARLVGPDGGVRWSDTLELTTDELAGAERAIAEAILRHVGGGLEDTDAAVTDPRAYDEFLRGEHALAQRTPASVVEAIKHYRAATDADSDFVAPLAREAYAYALFVDWGWTFPGMDRTGLLERTDELSGRALARDSASAEAWLSRAYLAQLADPPDVEGAARAYSRALLLDPSSPEAFHQYGQMLMSFGRWPEAKRAYHSALAIEAERPMSLIPLGAVAEREGDEETARRWIDSAVVVARDAPYVWAYRGLKRLEWGDAAGAIDDAREALRIDPSYELPARSVLAAGLWLEGEGAAAEEELARARRAIVGEHPSETEAYYLAAALIHMDRPERAVDWILRTRPRSAWLWFYLQGPVFEGVRRDPRLGPILERPSSEATTGSGA